MTDPDIVTRLRESDGGYFMRKMFTEAADEIERLRNTRYALEAERDELIRIANKMNCERDEARRLAIELQVQLQQESGYPNYLKETVWQTLRRIAKERGWDCFEEKP